MAKALPQAFKDLMKVRAILEKHFKDVQDVEFTIQEGKLFMLQTRNGKRTAAAALKFSIDMVNEKLIDWKTAILRNPLQPGTLWPLALCGVAVMALGWVSARASSALTSRSRALKCGVSALAMLRASISSLRLRTASAGSCSPNTPLSRPIILDIS